MTETLAQGYTSESTQRELSNEYQHDRVKMVFKNLLCFCALDESSLSIGRVNGNGMCAYAVRTLSHTVVLLTR